MATFTTSDRLLTDKEAATFLGLKPNTLATWRCSSRYGLPFVKVGKAVRYRMADLEKWLAARTVGAADAQESKGARRE